MGFFPCLLFFSRGGSFLLLQRGLSRLDHDVLHVLSMSADSTATYIPRLLLLLGRYAFDKLDVLSTHTRVAWSMAC